MGLGSVVEGNSTYLSVAGGYIWNRKAGSDNPNFATQEYTKQDKTVGTRQGARYADLTASVKKVEFRTHKEYGESINVTLESGDETFIVSITTNNRNSQDFMKALLVMNLGEELYIKPYDFMADNQQLVDGKWVKAAGQKRQQGISFRQDGEKLQLKNDSAPTYDGEWSNKKAVKRFFEDLSDWFVAEVEAKVIPRLGSEEQEKSEESQEDAPQDTEKSVPKKELKKIIEESKPTVSVVAMKKVIKAYISENYDGKTLPKLSKEEVSAWHSLCLAEDELPFADETSNGEEKEDNIKSQLEALMKK